MRLDEIDRYNNLARQLKGLPGLVKPGDLCKVGAALESLRGLPFPPGYLDGIRDEMLHALGGGSGTRTSVYLAFYGMGDSASHLKIGIAKSVKHRLLGIKTGNPMPLLWAFSATLPSREDAQMVERALLAHMSDFKVHGEWVHVAGLSLYASASIAESLAEVACECAEHPVEFTRFAG